ncbi:hypothetical protein BDC45DRAFT_515319 [Circinella umbellata]|nr:hypothetical protein BDC45DRAFT_515319 [Circinella umbellata]
MENPEPIVVIKRETTPAGSPPVVLITGVFIKHKRPIIVDERRDQSKELMVFDRRSTTAVSKDFSSPGFYPLDVTHGPLMSLLAAVRLLDPVESSQPSSISNTLGAIPPTTLMNNISNSNNNNQQQQNFSYPMVFPQNNMYYGMPVQPGMPTSMAPPNTIPTAAASLPPQLLPVLQPYLFSQQQQHQQQQHFVNQQQQKSSQYQPNSYTQRKPIQLQQQQQHTTASSSSLSGISNFNDIINSTSSARSSPALVVNSNSNSNDLINNTPVRSSPAQFADGQPTELRNASISPNNNHHRIRRKQPHFPPNSTDTPNNHNNNNNNRTIRRRVRFAKTDQIFSYDVDEHEHADSYPAQDKEYDYNDEDEDDIDDEDEEDDYYDDYDEEEEEDLRMVRHRWSPRTIPREQSHDVYNFQSRPPPFPYRRRGRRRWPVAHRPPLHLHHTEV